MQRRPQGDIQPEDVEERQHAEHDVVAATGSAAADRLLQVREQVAVAEHGRLGRARRSRGEHQHGEVVGGPGDGGDGGRGDGEAGSGTWEPQPLPGPRADAYGAGDSFAAGLTTGLAAGLDIGVPVLVLASTATEFARRWHEGLRTVDVVLDVDQIAARAVKLGPHVTVVRIAEGEDR